MAVTRFDIKPRILYADSGIAVLDKPASLPATGQSLADPHCLQSLLAAHYRHPVWAVHQLDADTSGVIVFALRRSLVPIWSERLKAANGGVKRYLAVCHGQPAFKAQTVEAPLGWIPRKRRFGVTPGGKPSTSLVRVLHATQGHGLLEVTLVTGRTHQIRIHLAHIGHPLVGERRYIEPPCKAFARQALHAHRLFVAGETPAEFVAPVPDDLAALCRALGLDLGTIGH